MPEDDRILSGVHPSPNIQSAPEVYEIENEAADPDGRIEAAMHRIAPWAGKTVLDIGAGTGFHIARFHGAAAHVIAVEPHAASRLRAMQRVAALGLERASVLLGSAERLLLPDASVHVAHARFAYFFPPDCDPGLRELERVVRPGGAAFIVDNDLRSGTFASWLRRTPEGMRIDSGADEAYWRARGFEIERIPSEWRFQDRADLEAVLRLEFPSELAEQLLTEHEGLRVEYHYLLAYRRY